MTQLYTIIQLNKLKHNTNAQLFNEIPCKIELFARSYTKIQRKYSELLCYSHETTRKYNELRCYSHETARKYNELLGDSHETTRKYNENTMQTIH